MTSNNHHLRQRADRVRLILEVRNAYRRFAELLQEYRGDSPPMRGAFVQATRRLAAMNRALALVALESAQRSSFEQEAPAHFR